MTTLWTPERQQRALAECNRWKGTMHIDRIARVGVGVDCVNFVHEVLVASGIVTRHPLGTYPTDLGIAKESHTLRNELLRCLHSVAIDDITKGEFGDIAVMKTGGRSAHCGLFIGTHLWHSMGGQHVTRSPWNLWRHRCKHMVRIYADGWRETP